MKDLNKALQQLPLSPTATKAYLALLELGKTSADKIAKHTSTYKSNVYDALEKLSTLGLVTSIFEDNKRLFVPTNPNKLRDIIQDIKNNEMNRITNLQKEITKVLPQLNAAYKSTKEKEQFEVYHGRKAYKILLNEIVKEKPTFWKGFGNLQIQSTYPFEFKHWFKKTKIKLFSTKTQEVINRYAEARKTTSVQIHWLPKEIYMPIVWVIFGNNLLIVIYEPNIVVMRIKSTKIVKTFSNQFDYLWNTKMRPTL